ncbi:MAG TPA: PKD domain-containing protein [Bacteroidia bacterium]|jgi:PKD repeat protein|nr:PKD domain-containing protein [Bacteroidia bacterium]
MKTIVTFLLTGCGLLLLSFTGANTRSVNPNTGKTTTDLSITFKPDDPKPGTKILFNANSYGRGNTYIWDFGDGSESVVTTVASAGHSYSKVGTYRVRIHSNDGGIAATLVMVTN